MPVYLSDNPYNLIFQCHFIHNISESASIWLPSNLKIGGFDMMISLGQEYVPFYLVFSVVVFFFSFLLSPLSWHISLCHPQYKVTQHPAGVTVYYWCCWVRKEGLKTQQHTQHCCCRVFCRYHKNKMTTTSVPPKSDFTTINKTKTDSTLL